MAVAVSLAVDEAVKLAVSEHVKLAVSEHVELEVADEVLLQVEEEVDDEVADEVSVIEQVSESDFEGFSFPQPQSLLGTGFSLLPSQPQSLLGTGVGLGLTGSGDGVGLLGAGVGVGLEGAGVTGVGVGFAGAGAGLFFELFSARILLFVIGNAFFFLKTLPAQECLLMMIASSVSLFSSTISWSFMMV